MITDRTSKEEIKARGYDSFIVTGSIGPNFEVRLFKTHKSALAYAREIDKTEAWPPYKPVIESRYVRDMLGRLKLED